MAIVHKAIPSKDVHISIPRTCECYLTGKRDIADILRILRWEGDSGLSEWPNVITNTPLKGRQESQSQIKRAD